MPLHLPIYNRQTDRQTDRKILANKRSQSALEYMMTYGWAILIIVIVAAVLYSFGIFSPSSSISATITGFSGLGSVQAQCIGNQGLTIQLGNSAGYTIQIANISVSASGKTVSVLEQTNIAQGESKVFYISNVCPSPSSRYSLRVTVSYTEPGQVFSGPYTSTGTITGSSSKQQISSTQTFDQVIPITITNSQDNSTPNAYQQMVIVPSSVYGGYSAPNFQNVEFFYSNGSVVPSWLQNYTSTNATWWLKLPSISASSSKTIYMGFASKSANLFNTLNDGEAPQLSSTYAEYDDGANVFNEYADFNGVNDGDVTNTKYSVINDGVVFSSNTGVGGQGVGFTVFNTIYFNQTLMFYGAFFNGAGIPTDNGNLFLVFGSSELSLNDYNSIALVLDAFPAGKDTNYPTNGHWFVFSEGAINNTNKTGYSNKNFGDTYEVNFPLGNRAYSSSYNIGPVEFFTQQSSLSNLSIKYVMVLNAPPNGIMPSVSFGYSSNITKPANIQSYAPLIISNNQNASVSNFQQMVNVPSSVFAGYANTASGTEFQNVEFFYANGTVIPSWLENYTSSNALYWIKLPSVPAATSFTVYLGFAPTSTNLFNTNNIGEAPQLSSTYGEYDDGANIFNNYWNFAGTSLPSGWTVPSSSNYQVDNGFIPEPSVGSTTAVYNGSIEETNSIIAEWGIDLSSTTYSSTNSYFQLNRYTPNSNMHFLGAQGSDILDNNNNNDNLITKAIASTGVQVFGVWNDGTNVDWLYNEGVLYSTTSGASVTDYLSLGWADNSQLYNFPTIYYVRTRAYPPNGVMPSVSFGSIE
jgi:hypothetical protein